MEHILFLIISVFASNDIETNTANFQPNILENSKQNVILVKIEEEEYAEIYGSNYIGVSYNKQRATWGARRWSKTEGKDIHNGCYKSEVTAAHASDTLARKLIANGEKGHKLNFPDDSTEVNPETERVNFIGVFYRKAREKWCAQRWSKEEDRTVFNGIFKDEATAAHASDTLARKLIANGEKGHKLNFPDDYTEVNQENRVNYVGVSYNQQKETWRAQRWSKSENKNVHNGTYKDEEAAAHASDTLARKLIANGEKRHKFNFPDDDTEVWAKENHNNKRKRPADFENSQKCGKILNKFE